MISRPFGLASAASGRLCRAVAPGAILHTWSIGLADTVSRAAERIGGRFFLSIPHLPHKNEDLQDLPWMIGSLKCFLTVPTQSERDRLLALRADPSRVSVMPPAAIPLDREPGMRERVRAKLGIESDDLVITTPTEMTLSAGHKFVLWSHAIVRRIRDGIKVVFPGSGSEEKTVRSFAETTGFSDDVHFVGDRFSRAEIASASDIAMFCRKKACGLTRPVTSMANGLVVATTSTDEMNKFCTNGENSLVFEDNAPQGISRGLASLVDCPDLRDKIVSGGMRFSRNRFDPEKVRGQLRDIYERS